MISILNSIICPRLWRKGVLGTMLAKSIPWFESWLHPKQFVEDEKCRSKIFIQRSPHTLFWRTRWASSAIYRVRLFVMEIGYKCHIMLMFKLCIFFFCSDLARYGRSGWQEYGASVLSSMTRLDTLLFPVCGAQAARLFYYESRVCALMYVCVCVKCKQSCSVCL